MLHVDDDAQFVELAAEYLERESDRLRVTTAESAEQVFESGYTTSEEGTGLGLKIVEGIVEAHGWDVQIDAGSRGGARFEFTGVESVG